MEYVFKMEMVNLGTLIIREHTIDTPESICVPARTTARQLDRCLPNPFTFLESQKEGIMKIPQYVSIEEVKRVCRELKISDWTKKKEPKASVKEAKVILAELNPKGLNIDLKEFCRGLEVELEHGMQFKDANVTNNHPLLTGLIVLAHFKESLDYYKLLEVAELEGDLMKAVGKNNAATIKEYYKRLSKAKIALNKAVLNRLT
jgi:hypothetical protein